MTPYRPANGSEGMDFMAAFCERCRVWVDDDVGCDINNRVLCFDVTDAEYPKEWVQEKGDVCGRTARCTAFVLDPARERPLRTAKPRRRRWPLLHAVTLFLFIVWRRHEVGRLDWHTAWEVARGIWPKERPVNRT
jgi:hypothetical protein